MPARAATLKAFLSASRKVYTPIALLFIAVLLVGERRALYERFAGVDGWSILGIILLLYLGHLCIGLSNWLQFRAFGIRLSFAPVLAIYVSRLPARYIPGGIWQALSRSLDFVERGVPAKGVLAVMSAEWTLSAAVAAMLGGLCLLLSKTDYPALAAGMALTGLATVALVPLATAQLRRNLPTMAWPALMAAMVAFFAVWLFYATGFWLFLNALGSNISWLQTTGIFLFSWLVGFFALFAPQGVGVFETTAGMMLAEGHAGMFIATLFGFRVVSLAADLSLFALLYLFRMMGALLGRAGSAVSP
jgi:glycosyltransferase 2 family protein